MAETKTRFEALTGGRIVEGYSLTEGMMALCVNPLLGRNKIESVGLPLPDVQVCIFATYGFGDDNKYFELQQLDGDAALEVAPVQLTCASFIDIGARAPVVLAIAESRSRMTGADGPRSEKRRISRASLASLPTMSFST